MAFCSYCSMHHECFYTESEPPHIANNSYGDSAWTPPPSPRASSSTFACSTGGSECGFNPYAQIRAAWDSGQTKCIWGDLSVLVFANESLSSCYLYDRECSFRDFGTENVDWQNLAFTLWPTDCPLGFIIFWLDEQETWSISARSVPETVGVKSALCYSRQNGVLPWQYVETKTEELRSRTYSWSEAVQCKTGIVIGPQHELRTNWSVASSLPSPM